MQNGFSTQQNQQLPFPNASTASALPSSPYSQARQSSASRSFRGHGDAHLVDKVLLQFATKAGLRRRIDLRELPLERPVVATRDRCYV
jgi:hypothetical protein